MNTGQNYVVEQARYSKGNVIVRSSDGSGLKTRAARLLGALRFRWTNREHGYIGSPAKLRKFEQLFADGWDATIFDELEPPRAP